MALVPAEDINAGIDNGSTLRRPRVIKMVVYGSSSAALFVEANQAFAGNAGWMYIPTASSTAVAAASVSARVVTRL